MLAPALFLLRGLNRTFVELKQGGQSFCLSRFACLNRTFVELKQINSTSEVSAKAVLIEPLWN
mgnify:CR=1